MTRRPLLIVDDDESSLYAVVAMARSVCPDVIAVWSAASALAVVERTAVSLVLSDLDMPDGTGIDLALALEARNLDVPVVLMSGRARSAVVESSRGCRLVRAVLEKPFRLQALRDTLRDVEAERQRTDLVGQ